MTSTTIRRLVGVYDADGSWRGELAYWIGARLGRAHCSLCDVTHGLVRERDDWRRCRDQLPVAFATYHRDDQPADVRAAVGAALPAVMAETDRGIVMLVGPEELRACDGSPSRLVAAIELAVTDGQLSWQ